MARLPGWFAPVLLAGAIAAAYANGLDVPFVFDDWHTIEQNPAIRTPGRMLAYFVDPDTTTVLRENKDLRPLLLVTMALNYQVSGLHTWSYHVVNLVLHWLVALLVFRIVRDHLWLGAEATFVALAAALVVAVHPLNTEPVNYVSARSALLTAAFYLAAFDAACRDRRWLCLVLAACAMLTKSIAVSLPLMVLVHRLFDRRAAPPEQRRPLPWRLLGGLALVAAGGVLYRWWLLPPWVVASARQPDVTPRIYFQTQWSGLLYYLRLFVWPDALVIDRLDFPWVRSVREVRAWGSLLALAALGLLAWRLSRVRLAFGFSALWIVITLAPESSFFPLAEAVNEHRPYLAMLGLATFAALVLWFAAVSVARRLAAPPGWVFAVGVTFVTTLLGAATHARTETWRDNLRLWVDATEKAPANPRAWLNAGHAALGAGDLAHARTWLLEAHRLSPCYAYVQLNLSALEAREGHDQESMHWADDAVLCNPGLALARAHRAATLERLGRIDDALAEYRETTRLDPAHAGAWLAQGRLLEAHGEWAAAAEAYDRALAADPTSTEAAMRGGLARQYYLADSATAVERFRAVLALDPHHYGAHYQIAVALLGAGRRDEAVAAWARFVPMAEAIGDRASIDAAPAELRAAG
jgi:cytochrome c-type biogenesis protein CcmH/NrfG